MWQGIGYVPSHNPSIMLSHHVPISHHMSILLFKIIQCLIIKVTIYMINDECFYKNN